MVDHIGVLPDGGAIDQLVGTSGVSSAAASELLSRALGALSAARKRMRSKLPAAPRGPFQRRGVV